VIEISERITSQEIQECLYAGEYGDGLLFKHFNKDKFLFNNLAGEWMVWNGNTWEFDIMNRAYAAMEDVVEGLMGEDSKLFERVQAALKANDKEKARGLSKVQDRIHKRIFLLRTNKGRANALKMARQSHNPMAIKGNELDRDPWSFKCPLTSNSQTSHLMDCPMPNSGWTFIRRGRLTQIPAQHKKQQIILERLVEEFEPDREYAEREVNQILVEFHDDVAALRRGLVGHGLMERTAGIYRRVVSAPDP